MRTFRSSTLRAPAKAMFFAAALLLAATGCSDDSGSGPSNSEPGLSSDSGNSQGGGGTSDVGGSSQSGGPGVSSSVDLGPDYNKDVPTTGTPRYSLTDADFAPGSGNGGVPETGDCGSETGDISPANGCMRYIGRV
ncbi:MAG: hypothetical protein J6V65_03385, partial [Fibrobacterales bacterium]|nr:hypothetical protein [Fibrobacterales bacterium]